MTWYRERKLESTMLLKASRRAVVILRFWLSSKLLSLFLINNVSETNETKVVLSISNVLNALPLLTIKSFLLNINTKASKMLDILFEISLA